MSLQQPHPLYPRTQIGRLGELVRNVESLPAVGRIARRALDIPFLKNVGGVRGVYSTFAEANASIPVRLRNGYDNAQGAELYRERLSRIHSSDYPAIFWLSRLLEGARRVFDFGGHVGVAHYAYQEVLSYPDGLEWCVCDVPAIVEAGRRLASERGVDRKGLTFTTNVNDGDGADLFFSAGALQYLEAPDFLARALEAMVRPPRHILLNKLPLHRGPSYVTVQNFGAALSPYRVLCRREFIAGLKGLGYEVVASWDNPELSCRPALYPAGAVESYSGLYLKRAESA